MAGRGGGGSTGGGRKFQITKLAVEGAGEDSFVRTEEEIEELDDAPTPPTPPSSAVSASCVNGRGDGPRSTWPPRRLPSNVTGHRPTCTGGWGASASLGVEGMGSDWRLPV